MDETPTRCPFCGEQHAVAGEFKVQCAACGAIGPGGVDRAQAIRLWNWRRGAFGKTCLEVKTMAATREQIAAVLESPDFDDGEKEIVKWQFRL